MSSKGALTGQHSEQKADGPEEDGEPRTPQSHRLKCPRRGRHFLPLQGHHLEKVSLPQVPFLATATTSWLHRGAVDLQVGPFTPRSCSWPHPLFDLCSHCHECLLNVGGVLGTRLQEGDTQRVCKFLPRGKKEIRARERRGEGK